MNATENTEILQDIWVSLNKENKEQIYTIQKACLKAPTTAFIQ